MTVLYCIGIAAGLYVIVAAAMFRGVPAAIHLIRPALRRVGGITHTRGGHRK